MYRLYSMIGYCI